jgi:hypothetical protein
LQPVDVRQVWQGESVDFTPWLAQAENIALLGEAIHLDLEVVEREMAVGRFWADILCKDTATGDYVVVENQLERTDHGHLGQVMTYAAGLGATTVVWVAPHFTDEHRAALDWLNRMTTESLNFFGLEIEAWRIGESAAAPKFNVVSQPNDWSKTVKEHATANEGLSAFEQLHLEFWTQFKEWLEERESPLRVTRPSKDHWQTFALGRTGFTLFAGNGMRDGRSWVYLAITGPNAKAYFAVLRAAHGAVIDQLAPDVEWRELPDRKESQVRVMRTSQPSNKDTWPELNAVDG